MAELGQGSHRSGDISEILGRKVSSLAPTRVQLRVPLFDGFMHRVMPGDDWKE
ncbi:MAG: hypothetical protein U9P12_03785 [Verrucomicrobiota bacterium]|nr:hypothetical protein [Verrucomicrobiota bacterium]